MTAEELEQHLAALQTGELPTRTINPPRAKSEALLARVLPPALVAKNALQASPASIEETTACTFCSGPVAPHERSGVVNRATGQRAWAHRRCAEDACRDQQRRAALVLELYERSWEFSRTGGEDASGAPLRVFPNMDFARFSNEAWRRKAHPKLLNVVAAYEARGPLLVLGDTGVGKTSAIVARQWNEYERLLREVKAGARRVIDFAYCTGFELSGCRCRSRIGNEAPLVEQMQRAALAIVDELGFEPLAPDGEVMTVLDHRYRRSVPTIVMSGLTREAFASRYGGAALRRLTEGGLLCDLHRPASKGHARAV